MLREWDAISSDLLEIYGQNVWHDDGSTWIEFRARVFALLHRPVSHDAFGHPVFTSMLQHRLLAPQKPPEGG